MRKPFVVGNWKMNTTRAEALALAHSAVELAATFGATAEVGIAPPAVWLDTVVQATAGSQVRVFAQNIGFLASGALTGETSVGMLRELGVYGTLVGHSERREHFGDTDARIRQRRELALQQGLHTILCVGETRAQREAGQTSEVVLGQLEGALPAGASLESLTIAYEPVWAIGTGLTATPAQAQEVHAAIRSWLRAGFGEAGESVRLQYGGSVKGSNAAELLAEADIEGALVGGASLVADDFARIVAAAAARA